MFGTPKDHEFDSCKPYSTAFQATSSALQLNQTERIKKWVHHKTKKNELTDLFRQKQNWTSQKIAELDLSQQDKN
jgi:hypothetical protein